MPADSTSKLSLGFVLDHKSLFVVGISNQNVAEEHSASPTHEIAVTDPQLRILIEAWPTLLSNVEFIEHSAEVAATWSDRQFACRIAI